MSSARPTPPSTTATRSACALPTALERAGDFSQTRDNNGNLFNLIRDHTTGLPCTATNTAGCFQAGGVLGRIPANRLYSTGLALLNRYPLPNIEQQPGRNYNYEIAAPAVEGPAAAAGASASTTRCRRSCASPASTRASARAG